MEALDGNAIAGPLFEYFGNEMTTAKGKCGHCGALVMIAELQIYSRAPGTVVRCPGCGNVVMVLVRIRDTLTVKLLRFRLAGTTGDR
jgi:predicted Zn finger-like uncharacterized protein